MSMSNTAITDIQDAVKQLKNVKSGQEFTSFLSDLKNFLKTLYIPNIFYYNLPLSGLLLIAKLKAAALHQLIL